MLTVTKMTHHLETWQYIYEEKKNTINLPELELVFFIHLSYLFTTGTNYIPYILDVSKI